MFRKLIAAALALTLLGCEEAENQITFGAKNFGESRVLAHMMAEIAKNEGLPVAGVVDYETTQAIQEALKRGDIDAYPEYNGTGLVMLGQNPTNDGAAATARVKELYEPLGFSWRANFGFANNYGLVMRPERAAELGITTMTELVSRAGNLSIGVEDDFTKRPLDGFEPMRQRYGLDFGSVEEVPLSERAGLYDRLIDGSLDIVEGYTTDGQIADYGLVVLKDDLGFFPVYDASPLARAAALSEHPGFGAALDALSGKIDSAAMQEMNGKVDIEGRSPQAVARDALARMGLIDSGAVEAGEPLLIAASTDVSDGAASTSALRAAREAFTGQDIQIAPSGNPLDKVASGEARLALVSSEAFFDLSGASPSRDSRFEAVAAVDQNVAHIVVHLGGPTNLNAVTAFLTGPEGSSSHKVATILAAGLGLSAEIKGSEVESTAALLSALTEDSTEAAVVFSPEGDRALIDALAEGSYRLMPILNWSDGPNLVKYPFMRPTRIAGGTYSSQFAAVETLGAQLVLAGPTDQSANDIVGDQGPSSIVTDLTPISSTAVMAINESIPGTLLIDPTLQQAAALAPALPEPPASINPATDISILNLLVVSLFVWLVWLFVRPEYR
ncbi:MAG: glycine betaine ABC transporter substrate-binding protein [Pseudomonadota bacterium]